MSSQDSYGSMSMPSSSPPPPQDISSYSRFMHQHTKRQMEAASRSSHRRGGRSSQNSHVSALPNGVSNSSTDEASSPNSVEYHD
ncbi:uncharacterized protein PG998_006816 [Apiospora kogelbergensis]|uniref:Uncharacterized protein n=1 Tax=Apiospora kogelbergensis TaxID=1337665 RepID=A0AAW0QM91_9PEZI